MNRHNQHLSSGTGKRRARGVTLIELLITVAIVSIIAAIAIPSYNTYILRTHRTEAKSALLSMAAGEERFYSTQNVYTAVPTQLGYTGGAFPINVGSNYYSISMTAGPTAATTTTQAAYTLTATAINGQVADTACATFSVDQSGTQTATGSATASVDCWK
jgi:type IV pilus assembly protein PilE